MDTPELDKMLKVKEQSQICGEFLEFLKSKYDMFDRKVPREDNIYLRGTSDYINNEKLLAEFFEIDLNKAEEEKRALLEIEMNKHKPHHCQCCGVYIEDDFHRVCDKCASEFKF